MPPQPTRLLDYINLAALALSPLIAVLVAARLQERKERRQQRFLMFQSLMATRNELTHPDHVRALNMIDVVFAKSQRVRSLWHELFAMLSNTGLNDANGAALRAKKHLELITEMAAEVGYGKAVSHLDVDRVYNPNALADQNRQAQEIAAELLRVLKATSALHAHPIADSVASSGTGAGQLPSKSI